jgi:hypothetical protein
MIRGSASIPEVAEAVGVALHSDFVNFYHHSLTVLEHAGTCVRTAALRLVALTLMIIAQVSCNKMPAGVSKLPLKSTPEFRISDRATARMFQILVPALETEEMQGFYPLIMWSGAEYAPDGSPVDIIPGPSLMLDNNKDRIDLAEGFYDIGKYKIYIFLRGEKLDECRKKVLDFRKGQFVFVYEDD